MPITKAIEDSAALGQLASQVQESGQRLKAIQSLIPQALRPSVQAGPINDDVWCLLVTSNSAAAKMRQLLPLILTSLKTKGLKVNSIRLKILIGGKL